MRCELTTTVELVDDPEPIPNPLINFAMRLEVPRKPGESDQQYNRRLCEAAALKRAKTPRAPSEPTLFIPIGRRPPVNCAPQIGRVVNEPEASSSVSSHQVDASFTANWCFLHFSMPAQRSRVVNWSKLGVGLRGGFPFYQPSPGRLATQWATYKPAWCIKDTGLERWVFEKRMVNLTN